jgi:hypothetical protein
MSKALKELGKRIAAREGIEPPGPGQRRPMATTWATTSQGSPVSPAAPSSTSNQRRARRLPPFAAYSTEIHRLRKAARRVQSGPSDSPQSA